MANDAPTVDYRALLEEERSDLLAKLAELGFGDGQPELSYDSNFADTSQVTAERGEVDALAGQLRDTLNEVEAALSRLASGGYGVCESCGSQISPARLEAKPAARRCIACATKT
ncbi:MAG: TraR/DksA C4-type zinc finger protein [Actinomycetota bacterium]|nr:TraR/DksA C4-type zinc finger protein [Actinomycetota bacterium]